MKRRAVVYLRVSTGEQTTVNQRAECLRLVRARGWELVGIESETASAVGARPVLKRVLEQAHKGKFDVLVVWALDRLGRSLLENLSTVIELDRKRVKLTSVRESYLEHEGPQRMIVISVLSSIAEFERERLVERTKAGLARARAQGVRFGRPPAAVDLRQVKQLRAQVLASGKPRLTWKQIARRLGVSRRTAIRAYERAS